MPFISGFYAALLALMVLGLAFYVVHLRFRHEIGLGHEGVRQLHVAIRTHANLLENAPIFLLLLLLLELQGAAPNALHIMASAFVIARLAHAVGMVRAQGNVHPARFIGILVSWLMIAVAAIWLLYRFVMLQLLV